MGLHFINGGYTQLMRLIGLYLIIGVILTQLMMLHFINGVTLAQLMGLYLVN